jgi:hypothetical protein
MRRRLAASALLGLMTLASVTCWGDDPKPPPAPAEDPDPSFLEFLGSVDRLAEVNPDYLTPVGRPPGAAPPKAASPPPPPPPPPPPQARMTSDD